MANWHISNAALRRDVAFTKEHGYRSLSRELLQKASLGHNTLSLASFVDLTPVKVPPYRSGNQQSGPTSPCSNLREKVFQFVAPIMSLDHALLASRGVSLPKPRRRRRRQTPVKMESPLTDELKTILTRHSPQPECTSDASTHSVRWNLHIPTQHQTILQTRRSEAPFSQTTQKVRGCTLKFGILEWLSLI